MTKAYTRETFKTKEDWLNNGRVIGGSSASAIVGMNPWTTKLEIFNSFFQEKKQEGASSASKTFGTEMEPLIRKQYRLTHPQYKVRDPKGWEMYRSKKHWWMTATVDGLLTEVDTKRKGVWECKTHDIRNAEDALQWETGSIPKNYQIQVLHYLLVLNDCSFVELTAWLNFYDYTPSGKTLTETKVKYYHIERDDQEVQRALTWLYDQEVQFMQCVEQGIPPNGKIEF